VVSIQEKIAYFIGKFSTMGVTTKEVTWQSQHGSHLVHKGDMAYGVECFGKIQSYNVDKVIVGSKSHAIWNKATSAADEPDGLNANWSEKQ